MLCDYFAILTVNSVLAGYSHRLRSAVPLQIKYLAGDYTIAKRCSLEVRSIFARDLPARTGSR